MAASLVNRSTIGSGNGEERVTVIKCETTDDSLGLDEHPDTVSTTMALGINSTSNHTYGSNNETLDCVVCGDRATGKHYGAISCDGCKGFFRRSVRKNPIYECRHQNSCTIDKDKRNQCRHCRWKKCIRMGMKKDAVQKERDRLGRQRNGNYYYGMGTTTKIAGNVTGDLDDDDDDLSVAALLRAEQTAQEYIGRQIQFDRHPSDAERVNATLETIGVSMNYQLRSLIEWAKDLKGFIDLSDNDKIALLRGHTGENLVLGLACRSLACDDFLLLGNHHVIRRNATDPGLSRATGRILDEIAKPLKEIQLDESEYACLKAIVFFDNDNKSLADPMRVKELRKRIQVNLETYINQNRPQMRGRFGELLLLMPPLQNIARLMVDLVARYNQDTKQVDDLINEMLLNRYRDDCQQSVISTTTNHIGSSTLTTTASSSPSNSISKENDLDSNASSIDTDMEDGISQDNIHSSSATPMINTVMIVPTTHVDDLRECSLSEHDDYLCSDLSHIHLLHSSVSIDPNLNHHNSTIVSSAELNDYQHEQVLQFLADTTTTTLSSSSSSITHDRLRPMKRSKSISTSTAPNSAPVTVYDPNEDINFLYDLMTPPSTTIIRQTSSQSHNHLLDMDWTGRMTSLPTSTNNTNTLVDNIKQDHEQRRIRR